MVAIFGFDGGISIVDALAFLLNSETIDRISKVLARIHVACRQNAETNVYVRIPLNGARKFWFVGTVARESEVATGYAVAVGL